MFVSVFGCKDRFLEARPGFTKTKTAKLNISFAVKKKSSYSLNNKFLHLILIMVQHDLLKIIQLILLILVRKRVMKIMILNVRLW